MKFQFAQNTIDHRSPKSAFLMNQPSLFHKDISNPNYLDRLSPDERATVERFIEDMRTGPADGGMDGDWQHTAHGYYVHLEILSSLTSQLEQDRYREQLREDIEAWLQESPSNHMVLNVKEQVFGNG